jgi:hypothetical protein
MVITFIIGGFKMKDKVILAYSGGLDTTAIIPWLMENYDYEVICVCINVGQGNELDGLEERAKLSGATKLYIEDVVDEFVNDYVMPCVKANAVYEHKYLLGTSMARPVIAKRLVEIARLEGATAICHGATGKGNDQVRFELTIKALAPDLKIIIYKFIYYVLNIELCCTGKLCSFFQAVQFISLSYINTYTDYLIIIIFFKPGNDSGCVKSTGISKYNLFFHFITSYDICNFQIEYI